MNWEIDVKSALPEVRLPTLPIGVERSAWGDVRGTESLPSRVLCAVVFIDIVGSAALTVAMGDDRWRALLATFYASVRRELVRFRGREIDTAGDGVFAAFDTPTGAIRCASRIVDGVRPLGIDVRAGLHAGECEILGDKLCGIAVHLGARIAALANAGEILVSTTVKDLVAGAGIAFEDRGRRTLKGIPGEWLLFAVAQPGESAVPRGNRLTRE